MLAIAFLFCLIRGLGGILIKALAALAVYVTHDFRYFHRLYLCVGEERLLEITLPRLLIYQYVVGELKLAY